MTNPLKSYPETIRRNYISDKFHRQGWGLRVRQASVSLCVRSGEYRAESLWEQARSRLAFYVHLQIVMKKPSDPGISTYELPQTRQRGTGPGSAGQSGDTQGLSGVEEAGPESVEELVEEGQSFEAEAISGVEDAGEPDEVEVHTKQFPEDDVPQEYLDQD
jgi:hypothetical protein